jgi:hypothetical protein
VRYAGDISSRLSGVVGVLLLARKFAQILMPLKNQERLHGVLRKVQQRSLWETPGLFEDMVFETIFSIKS